MASTTSVRAHTVAPSPLGDLLLVRTDERLSHLLFGARPDATRYGERTDRGFEPVVEQLAAYFDGELREFAVETAARGDDLQRQVWSVLATIPYGETRSYGEVARALGDPSLARAVGAANAANPIAIIVPCHRVIGSDGSLTGYAGGIERKRFLLDLELRDTRLF